MVLKIVSLFISYEKILALALRLNISHTHVQKHLLIHTSYRPLDIHYGLAVGLCFAGYRLPALALRPVFLTVR